VGRAVVARGDGNDARGRECAARAKKIGFSRASMRVFARRFQPARRRRPFAMLWGANQPRSAKAPPCPEPPSLQPSTP